MVECSNVLIGLKVLVVEDEYLIAANLYQYLFACGLAPVGPFGCVKRAVNEVDSGRTIDAAILDINIGGEPVFPVADRLAARDVPFLFATGYDDCSIPDAFLTIERLEKPLAPDTVMSSLAAMHKRQSQSAMRPVRGPSSNWHSRATQ